MDTWSQLPQPGNHGPRRVGVSFGPVGSGVGADMDDLTIAELLDELDARREELAADGDRAELRDFVWTVRGGAWTAAHAGV
eukprot:8809748-Pyramimonas_sp.AAC.1